MRVEQLICEHLRDSYNKYHFTNKVHIFIDWRNNYDSCSNAMSDAIKKDFNIGISHMSQIVKSAYDKLMESGDNAVLYFLETSKILPSQQVEFPFSPCFNWLNSQETCGSVKTPSGSPLGIIRQRYDGFWLINPSANNLLEYMLANNKIDAIRYLVTSFIKPVLITINDQNHTIYLVKYDSNSTEGHSTRVTEPYQFHFWDDSHNIELGQHIKLQINENDSPWIETFEGKVTDVQSEKITLECQRRLS